METVLAALLATAVELLVVMLIVAPRWFARKLKSTWRRLLYGSRAETQDATVRETLSPVGEHHRSR